LSFNVKFGILGIYSFANQKMFYINVKEASALQSAMWQNCILPMPQFAGGSAIVSSLICAIFPKIVEFVSKKFLAGRIQRHRLERVATSRKNGIFV